MFYYTSGTHVLESFIQKVETMSKLEEHMVLNPEMKKKFNDTVRKSKAKAKSDVRKVCCFIGLRNHWMRVGI